MGTNEKYGLVRALYDFIPTETHERIQFRRGDVFKLLNKTNQDWWVGSTPSRSETGYFPANHVEILHDIDTPIVLELAVAIQDCNETEDPNSGKVFTEGEYVFIVNKDNTDYWEGISEVGGRSITIPVGYVQIIDANQSPPNVESSAVDPPEISEEVVDPPIEVDSTPQKLPRDTNPAAPSPAPQKLPRDANPTPPPQKLPRDANSAASSPAPLKPPRDANPTPPTAPAKQPIDPTSVPRPASLYNRQPVTSVDVSPKQKAGSNIVRSTSQQVTPLEKRTHSPTINQQRAQSANESNSHKDMMRQIHGGSPRPNSPASDLLKQTESSMKKKQSVSLYTPSSSTSPSQTRKPSITYKALYKFEPAQDGDLGFEKGDIIKVSDTSRNWYVGLNTATGKIGTFPSNYVEEQAAPPEAPAPNSQWQLVVSEFFETERKYVLNLNLVIETFLKGVGGHKNSEGLIPARDVDTIFGNIEMIHRIHSQLLDDMQAEGSEQSKLQILVQSLTRFVPFLKAYTSYINGYDTAINHVQRLKSTNKSFAEFLQGQIKNSGGLQFEAFLIMPIQRMPRYELLIRDLMRYESEFEQEDAKRLQELAKSIKSTNEYLNESKRSAESRERVAQLHEDLKGKVNLFEDHANRKLIREGAVKVINPKGTRVGDIAPELSDASKWEGVRIFLFTDMLLRVKGTTEGKTGDRSERGLRWKLLTKWSLVGLSIFTTAKKDVFLIEDSETQTKLYVKSSEDDVASWVKDLKEYSVMARAKGSKATSPVEAELPKTPEEIARFKEAMRKKYEQQNQNTTTNTESPPSATKSTVTETTGPRVITINEKATSVSRPMQVTRANTQIASDASMADIESKMKTLMKKK